MIENLIDGKYYWIEYKRDEDFDSGIEIGRYSAYWSGFKIIGMIDAVDTSLFIVHGEVSIVIL